MKFKRKGGAPTVLDRDEQEERLVARLAESIHTDEEMEEMLGAMPLRPEQRGMLRIKICLMKERLRPLGDFAAGDRVTSVHHRPGGKEGTIYDHPDDPAIRGVKWDDEGNRIISYPLDSLFELAAPKVVRASS